MLAALVTALSLAGAPADGGAQEVRPVTLEEAVAEARQRSPDVRAARAQAEAAAQQASAAASYLWPTVGLEAGMMRTDDPVAAFGSRLRQGRFTQADFDPALLNDPAPLTDWSGAVGARWAPVDFSAEAARVAARRQAQAARFGADWAAEAAAFRAEMSYLQAVGARGMLTAAEAALAAAEANLRVVRRRAEEGLLTDADVLQAEAAAEGARARVIAGRQAVADAQEYLAVAMGWPAGAVPRPVDEDMPTPVAEGLEAVGGAGEAEVWDPGRRPDLRASLEALEAARASVAQASRARLPKVEAFARVETHAPEVADGLERSWTAGFQIRVPVFTGFAVTSQKAAAASMAEAARARHEGALRQARAEVAEARRGVASARRTVAASEAGARAAAEAARLMRRRFEEGLTTTADLLAAESRAAAMEAGAVQARLNLALAAARLAFLAHTTPENQEPLSGGVDR